MPKLNREELNILNYKKHQYMLTNADIATMLNIRTEDFFHAYLGRDVNEEVYQAVKEWIS